MTAYKSLIGNADTNMYENEDGHLKVGSTLRDFHEACHHVTSGKTAAIQQQARQDAIKILINTNAFDGIDDIEVRGFLDGVVSSLSAVLSTRANEGAAPYTVAHAGY